MRKALALIVILLSSQSLYADGVQVWAQQLPPAVFSASSANVTGLSVSSVPAGGVLAAADNASRLGMIIYNGPVSVLYGVYGTSVNLDSSVSFVIPISSTWTMPPPVYKGPVTLWRSTGTGRAVVTELK